MADLLDLTELTCAGRRPQPWLFFTFEKTVGLLNVIADPQIPHVSQLYHLLGDLNLGHQIWAKV